MVGGEWCGLYYDITPTHNAPAWLRPPTIKALPCTPPPFATIPTPHLRPLRFPHALEPTFRQTGTAHRCTRPCPAPNVPHLLQPPNVSVHDPRWRGSRPCTTNLTGSYAPCATQSCPYTTTAPLPVPHIVVSRPSPESTTLLPPPLPPPRTAA